MMPRSAIRPIRSAGALHPQPCPRRHGGRALEPEKGYRGYTSYASLNDLPKRDPAFADLAKLLARHAAKFAEAAAFDLARKPRLDSLWVNLLKAGGQHSGHIHPNAA